MTMKLIKYGIYTIILTLAAVMAVGCEAEETVIEVPAVPVIVDNPEIGTITRWHRTTCELQSPLESMLSFPNGGRIIELVVREGDTVVAGQYLGKVDTSGMAANLSAIRSSADGAVKQAEAADLAASAAGAGVELAQASYDQAVRDFERYEKLYEDGVATEAEFERIQLNVDTSRISLEGAGEQVDAALAQAVAAHAQVQSVRDQAGQVQVMINDGTLRAPFGGKIATVYYDPGTVAGPGTPIFKLVGEGKDTGNRLEVHLEIPETIIGLVGVGSPVYLDLASCDTMLQVAVDHLGPEVNSSTRTVEVVAYIDMDSLCLLPGMFGSVRIPLEIHEDALMVPEEAVLETDEYTIVYVAVEDTVSEGDVGEVPSGSEQSDGIKVTVTSLASRRDVETGIRESGMVEILSGLEPTDDVIVVGNAFLKDGAKVGIQGEDSTAQPSGESGMEEES